MSHVGSNSICLYLANSYREMNLAKSIYQRYGTMKKGIFREREEDERGKKEKEKKIVKRRNDDTLEKLTYLVKFLLHFSSTNFNRFDTACENIKERNEKERRRNI